MIKTRMLDLMKTGKIYSRKEIVKIYHQALSDLNAPAPGKHEGNLSCALCEVNGTHGYLCRPSRYEQRYITKIAYNKYKLAD